VNPRRVIERDTHPAAPQHVRAHHHGDRAAVPGDGDLLAAGHPVKDLGKGGPCLADRHRRHAKMYTNVRRRTTRPRRSASAAAAIKRRLDETMYTNRVLFSEELFEARSSAATRP
jgi:hypothetical protein